MAGYNKCTFIGNLTRDPEIRYVGSGAAVAKFTLAVNGRKKANQDQQPLYIDVITWDKLAETCNTYLKKGALCLAEGRLSIRSYETKEGEKRKVTELVAHTMQMLDRAPARNGAAPAQGEATAPAADYGDDLDDDESLEREIPF